ncbi:MAG TPA: type II secretion system F family protein [Burkholderiaceae bacterium]|jgi:MSHA biogenesis protein MshG
MPQFVYTARFGDRLHEGVQEAVSASAVASLLRSRGLIPLSILNSGEAPATPVKGLLEGFEQWRLPRVAVLELMLFSRQLHTLLRSGVPMLRALAALQESSPQERMRQTLQALRQNLESGIDFASSLALHPKIFDNFYSALVRVGELTGRLDEVLLRLTEHLEFEHLMKQQVKAAVRYPLFVLVVMAAAVAVINVFVIPAFAQVFSSFGATLPWATRVLVAASNFTLHFGWLLALLAAAAVVLWRQWIATPTGRLCWDRNKLRLPLAGKIIQKAALARLARSLSLALRSGVPTGQALTVVGGTVENSYIQAKVERMRESVEHGESMLRAAAASNVFTPVVLQMIAVGDETGALDELLDEVGQLYAGEVQYELKTLGQQIEPILIIFLGVLLLILALGVFLPVWDLGRVAIRH